MPYSPRELAEAFLRTGELDDALEALNPYLEQHPQDDELRRMRIAIGLRQDDPDALHAALQDIDALHTKSADDLVQASIAQERLGNVPAAQAHMQQALQLRPNDERLVERLLHLMLQVGALQPALALIRQQERSWRWLQWEGDVLVRLGNDLLATARYGLVLAALSEREGNMRDDYLRALRTRVLLARAHAYRRLGQAEIAAEHYQEARQHQPDDPLIDFHLGLLHAHTGEVTQALEQCRAALAAARPDEQAQMKALIEREPRYEALRQLL